MKVALIGPLPPIRGGIAQYNQSLLDTLRESGHELLPVSYNRLYPSFLFPGASQFDDTRGSTGDAIPILNAWDVRRWRRTAVHIREYGPDRLVIQHWHPFFSPCLNFLARTTDRSRVIVIAHNVLPHEHARIGKLLNPGLFRRAGRIIVGSHDELAELNRLVPGAPAVVVPHPAYTRYFRETAGPATERLHQARQALGIPLDLPCFVHLGLVREYKGVDLLLEAFAGLREDALLIVAGEFYDEFARYQDLHRLLNLGERCRFINRFLTDDELARYVEAADAVVLPHREATQSGVAMAALAGGAPVIATRTGALRDIIRQGENGLLAVPGNVSSLLEALELFLAEGLHVWRERRPDIAHRTRNEYSWQTLTRRVTERM